MPNAAISASSAGANQILAAPGAGKYYRITGYVLKVKSANDVKFQSAATNLTGLMGLNSTDSGLVAPPNTPDGWFDTNNNEALNLNLSAATLVGGHVSYRVMG